MGLIVTNEAECRDCYRCVRACPVKAIKIKSGEKEQVHAQVLDDFCVLDGKCVLSCPQKAKKVQSDLDKVKDLIKQGVPVAASVAPSFAAALPLDAPMVLPAILKQLGFNMVQETALGAELVAAEHRCRKPEQPVMDSSCPVIVNLVEKHFPNLIPLLSTVVSPMIAHGRYIKKQNSNITVVFIGPCIAKKEESKNQEVRDAVDYVLGFDELWEWIMEAEINPESVQPVPFNKPFPNLARLFPVEGGMLRTASFSTDMLDINVSSITGLEQCIEFLAHLSAGKIKHPPKIMELLACSGGCIGGPRSVTQDDIFIKRQKIVNYYKSSMHRQNESRDMFDPGSISLASSLLHRKFINKQVQRPTPDEEKIKEILAQTGKYKPGDELNCGACGYNSCRDKAIAVYQETAEVQMCIPYMRKRAESMSHVILNSMPNGVLVVDSELNILEMNPKAEEMFNCRCDELCGKKLDCLMDSGNFRKALEKKQLLNVMSNYDHFGITTREIIFPLDKEQVVVGIFVDITEEQRRKEQLDQMKNQTIERAREVIEKQMKVAQQIAGLLGETTAETKVLLTKLIKLMQEPPAPDERRPDKQ